MGVDYAINYGCVPKEVFTTEGLIQRVKAHDRADAIRLFYKSQGEDRNPEDMGFEMIYRTADGTEETRLIRIDELDKMTAELDPHEAHCANCPANRLKKPFGCIGNVNYPLSGKSEVWMLELLPSEDEPLPFLLLKEGNDMGNTGAQAVALRQNSPGVFFESTDSIYRQYSEMDVSGERLFELFFLLGAIQPKRAHMILMFLGAVGRDMEAAELFDLVPAPADAGERYPFLLEFVPNEDQSIRDIKHFLHTLYVAWLLNRDVYLDV